MFAPTSQVETTSDRKILQQWPSSQNCRIPFLLEVDVQEEERVRPEHRDVLGCRVAQRVVRVVTVLASLRRAERSRRCIICSRRRRRRRGGRRRLITF